MVPPLAATLSYASISSSSDTKRHIKAKDFQIKYGQKHHSYDNEKAPYPLSYDKKVLELELLDNHLARYLRGSVSFTKFDEPPQRVLDLGCGTGSWVIDAAKSWSDCQFIGFDLMDVQYPLKFLDPSISSRIEWKHGNFLTTKLPFEDDEFDHVHVQSIATGVPENKWGVLFEEINRVLCPGGSVEVMEDDAIFPRLPRWLTGVLRVRPLRSNSVHFPDGSQRESASPQVPNIPSHDHALLESLFKSVFENRFINLKPSSVLPSYLTTYFRQVTLGPVVNFPMPPLPPIQPLPPQIMTFHTPNSNTFNSRSSTIPGSAQHHVNRPVSLSFSSSISTTVSSSGHSKSSLSSRPRTSSAPFSYNGDNSISSFELPLERENSPAELKIISLKQFILDNSLTESEVGMFPPGSFFAQEKLEALSERSLAMHLYRSYQAVLACQEAMWEELKDRIRNKREVLFALGWDNDEELEELHSRKRFERLIERYRTDMQARISLWCSLDRFGWPLPAREPLTKAELIEEERLRESMIAARKQATVEEMQTPCRAVRVLVGYKL